MFRISIITIGDEILIGQIINTNVAKMSEICTKLGAKIVYQSTIGDNEDDMIKALDYAFSVSDLVLTSGGLGPTHDDITKPVILKYFNDNYIFSESTFQDIVDMFTRRGRTITEKNRLQALIPSKSKPLRNLAGTAPGIFIEDGNRRLIAMPGVPSEMMYIMENSVVDIIKNYILEFPSEVTGYKTIITAGIFESTLSDLIGEPENFPFGTSLAYLPSSKGVRLRIGAVAENFEKVEQKLEEFHNYIFSKAGKYVIGYDNTNIAKHIGEILKSKNLTLSVAESCTGGLLGSWITDIPGSSSYFAGGVIVYSNDAKIKLLGVEKEVIEHHGAVSRLTAEQLAENVRLKFNTDIGISITGIAGPEGGSDEKPVGTVYIGISDKLSTYAEKYHFGYDRIINRERAATQALNLLKSRIESYENTGN